MNSDHNKLIGVIDEGTNTASFIVSNWKIHHMMTYVML